MTVVSCECSCMVPLNHVRDGLQGLDCDLGWAVEDGHLRMLQHFGIEVIQQSLLDMDANASFTYLSQVRVPATKPRITASKPVNVSQFTSEAKPSGPRK